MERWERKKSNKEKGRKEKERDVRYYKNNFFNITYLKT